MPSSNSVGERSAWVSFAIQAAAWLGALALVPCALSVAHWASWLIEINEERPSGASGNITGRELLMLAEALLVVATTIGAALLSRRDRAPGPAPLILGAASLLSSSLLVGLNWSFGWYYHLQHLGPQAFLVLAAIQDVVLIAAGIGCLAIQARQADRIDPHAPPAEKQP